MKFSSNYCWTSPGMSWQHVYECICNTQQPPCECTSNINLCMRVCVCACVVLCLWVSDCCAIAVFISRLCMRGADCGYLGELRSSSVFNYERPTMKAFMCHGVKLLDTNFLHFSHTVSIFPPSFLFCLSPPVWCISLFEMLTARLPLFNSFPSLPPRTQAHQTKTELIDCGIT